MTNPRPAHVRLSDLRGFQRLASDATVGLTDLVEAMHGAIAEPAGVFGPPHARRTRGITRWAYQSVRVVTRMVGGGLDVLLDALGPPLAERPSSRRREAILAALNGVLGDHLEASANPLAIDMRLRVRGEPLALTREALAASFPQRRGRLLVLVHGLCMNDLQWHRAGLDHGAGLAWKLGYTPLYLHYNTGRHISANGRDFARLMESLVRRWPHPIERLTVMGHSMGGLVARSACHYAALAGHEWLRRLDELGFLGVPHLGAPLARAGAMSDYLAGLSPYAAPFGRLARIRSAGIDDLCHGSLRDEDWDSTRPARVPLPDGVACYAVAGSLQERPGPRAGRVRGDGLVSSASALGRHREPSLDLALAESHRWIAYGAGHFELLSSREVHAQLRRWLVD